MGQNRKYCPYISDDVRDMLVATNKWMAARSSNTTYRIHVVTGDKTGAGTDANVYLVLHDMYGNKSSVIRPKTLFSNDHERASTTTVEIKDGDLRISPPFASVQVWRDNFGNIPSILGAITEYFYGGSNKEGSAAWFLDRIEVEMVESEERPSFQKNLSDFNNRKRKISLESLQSNSRSSSPNCLRETAPRHVFPVQRWIEADTVYQVDLYDTSLPNQDERPATRKRELLNKRQEYRYKQNVPGGPAQAAILPGDEKFSQDYFLSFLKERTKLMAKTKFIEWTSAGWRSINELKSLVIRSLGKTENSMDCWDKDEWFGFQRLQGVNPYLISLCKEIPEKLDVNEETVSGLLGELSLKEALEQNKIFICDLEVLEGIPCKNNRKMAVPIALFFLKGDDELLPIAIQLNQKKGPNNPVFTPKDPPNTWIVAKMFYNNAEGQHHQGISHLGLTHLLMEGICLCSHRQLSPSHPMFKLMAPHFLYLIAINSRGLEKLISPGGWVDNCMIQGVDGIFELIKKGLKRHNFYVYGNVSEEIKSRGVLDPEILPYYPYRDDAVSLYETIRKYVSKVVYHYYDSEEKLLADWELREWRLELSKEKDKGGVGLAGVPGDDHKGYSDIEEVVETVTIIISTCSLGHAAANFQQFEQFGFPPNYPGLLMKDPPAEKKDYTEADIVELLPNMKTTLDTMVITKLLSSRGTSSIGDFEMQYLYHPVDIQAAEDFRKDLQRLSLKIQQRNMDRKLPFPWLDPKIVPNSISI